MTPLLQKNHAHNHSRYAAITSAAQAISLGVDGKPPTDHLTFLANIEHAWWHAIVQSIDILTVSPPCQPWSRAGSELGLETADGRLILQMLVQCHFLNPAIICLEEVASNTSHGYRHFYTGVDIESLDLA